MQSAVLAYSMFFVSLLFYSYQFIIRVMPSFVMDDMIAKFAVTSNEIAAFGAIYYAGYAIAHIPIGFLVDRFGARVVMVASSAAVALGTLPLLCSCSWNMVIAGRILAGIGSVGSVLGMFKLVRISFGARRFGFMIGLTVTAALLTIAESHAPVVKFVAQHSFDAFIKIIIVVAGITTVAMFIIIPGDKVLNKKFSDNIDDGDGEKASATMKDVWKDFISVVCDYRVILLSVVGGLMIGAFQGFADAWSPTFLRTVYNLSSESASFGGKAMFYGMAIGSPLLGYIMERNGSYFGIVFWSAVGLLVSTILLMMSVGNIDINVMCFQFNVVHIILLVIGLLFGYQVGILGGATSMVPSRLFSITSASANMIMMGFGTFFHKAMGGVIAATETVDGAYTARALQKGMAVIPSALLAAIILLGVLWSSAKKKRS